jgi:two-component system copper resistance phosphate regulon response regulator CusR
MRVLVTEDHASLARSIANGLREEGFAVDLTARGGEAVTLADANPYDCIVLDVMLPDRDGWSVLKHLRDTGSTSPVIMLTARDAIEDRVRGLNLGADDYLVKPFAWEELLARVRALVRRGHGQRNPVIQIADLEIDTAAKSVRRGGQPISLSAKEYALLEFLAHRQGKVVSRAQIWDHLYDSADETTSNVVDVYIGYLRNKIDRDHPVKLIQTRRGMGYLLSTV